MSNLSVSIVLSKYHDDVIKWKHFPRYWPFVRGIHRSPVTSPHRGQWRGALMFSLIYARINGWVNNREAGDMRRHQAHCGVIVMFPDVFRWCAYIALFCPKETRLRLTSLDRMQFVMKMCGSKRLVRELLCCDTIYRSYICITEYHFCREKFGFVFKKWLRASESYFPFFALCFCLQKSLVCKKLLLRVISKEGHEL